MKFYKHAYIVVYCLFIFACARQTTPTGGPKDTIPPTLLGSYPRHGQIDFKDNNIILSFSEAVVLNNVREQLIITPGLPENVDAIAKKNDVTIDLNQPLAENTTYTINFREAVQDITEKNPARNLKIAFSTGSYLDSLSIEGFAFEMLTGKPVKDATVAIYATDTLNIFQHKPPYFTKTDETGYFKLENLKPGSYRIYGIQDKNKNLVIDSKTESYGFLSNYVVLTANAEDLTIPLVRLDSRPLRLVNARPDVTYFSINTSKALTSFAVTTEEDEHLIASFGKDQTNVRIYNTFEDRDSLKINFTAQDSIYNKIDTTLYVKFSTRVQRKDPFELTTSGLSVIGAKGILEGNIKFSKPLLDITFDSIYYQLDSAHRIQILPQDISFDTLNNILTIRKAFDKTWIPQQETPSHSSRSATTSNARNTEAKTPINQFYFGKAAFISIELDSSQQNTEPIKPMRLDETGIIFVNVETAAPTYFVQLLDKQFNVVRTKAGAPKMSFEDLKPGDYQIRLVLDANNDGTWNPGNYFKNEQPEEIIFYHNDKGSPLVTLKANWELGPMLIRH